MRPVLRALGLAYLATVSIGIGSVLVNDFARADAPVPPAAAKNEQPVKQAAPCPPVEPNYIVGRVTMADGRPLAGDIKDIHISINGVTTAGQNVIHAPAVKEDGTFRQKVAPGEYTFGSSFITLVYQKAEIPLPLAPVGRFWNKGRDSTEGITQEFVLHLTGPTPIGQSQGLKTTNATHWYGMSIGLAADIWRQDIKKAPTAIPDGSRLRFNLKPIGKAIDGSDCKPLAIEKVHAKDINPDLHDLMPATYELSGTVRLPDGTVKPLLFQTKDEYPNYKPVVTVPLARDNMLGKMAKWPCQFVIE
jgi:hypothetical protein